jgi:hypothetical protein
VKLDYSRDEFFAHQTAWNDHFHSAENLTLAGQTVNVGDDKSTEANVMRMIFMILSMSTHDMVMAGKKGNVFGLVQMYLRTNADDLYRAGLITLHDGEMGVVKPETVAAVHEAFLDDPPADPLAVSVEDVIARAKVIAADHADDRD